MRELLALLLCVMLLAAAGCGSSVPEATMIPATSQPEETTVPVTEPEVVTDEIRAKWDAVAEVY